MVTFIIARTTGAITVIAVVVVFTFFVGRSVGDPVQQMLPPFSPPERFEALRADLGLDRPLMVQFREFAGGVVRGDLGESLWQKRSVMEIIWERIPNTLLLGGTALVIAFGVAIPLGILSAVRQGSLFDRAAMVVSIGSISMPHFWLGLLLILVFSVWLKVLPTSGSGSWRHLILPAVTVAALPIGRMTQIVRSAMLDALVQPYTSTARAKGLSERVVVTRHAFRNAAIPVATVAGWEVARILAGGMIIIETVFAWPGIGLLTIQAIRKYDFPLVEALIMVQAAIIVFVNLAIDISYVFIDPRLQARAG